VAANPGSDAFAVNTYSGQSGAGSLLSTGSITSTIIAGTANTLALVLGGVINSIAIGVPWSTLPLGESISLNVTALDASGATIVGTYDTPIALSGNDLSFAATTLPDSGTASNVTASWNLAFTGSAATTISATADGRQATATLTPGTGIAYYPIANIPAADSVELKMTVGGDGKLYFTSVGEVQCVNGLCSPNDGAIHQFDPTTGINSEIELHSGAFGVLYASDGSLWVAGGASQQIYRLPPGTFNAGALQTIPIPSPPPSARNVQVRALAQDSNGNVWFVDLGGSRVMEIPLGGPYTTASITSYSLPNGPPGTPQTSARGYGIVNGSDGNLYVMDRLNGLLDQVNPATGVTTNQFVTPQQLAMGSSDYALPYSLSSSPGGSTIYMSSPGDGNSINDTSFLDSFSVASGTYSNIALPSTFNHSVSDQRLTGSDLYFADLEWGLGVADLSNGTSREYPVLLNGELAASGLLPDFVAAMSDGTAWFTCYGSQPGVVPCLGHTTYLSGWSIFPAQSIALFGAGLQSEQLVGVMESPSANSGPFTAASSNTDVCTVADLNDHNFNVVGTGPGACLVTVTDAHGVSQTINVTVTTTSGTVQSKRRQIGGRI
jgi:streptogramin lyase